MPRAATVSPSFVSISMPHHTAIFRGGSRPCIRHERLRHIAEALIPPMRILFSRGIETEEARNPRNHLHKVLARTNLCAMFNGTTDTKNR